MVISDHISYGEVTKSMTAIRNGIDNTPNDRQLKNIILLAKYVLEPLRTKLGNRPIYYGSFFRCDELNTLIGGVSGSQHKALRGAAADIDNDGRDAPTNREIFDALLETHLFDQLIWEFGDDKNPDWVHISFNAQDNRNEVLKAVRLKNGRTRYLKYK